jgi:hypothetical protein
MDARESAEAAASPTLRLEGDHGDIGNQVADRAPKTDRALEKRCAIVSIWVIIIKSLTFSINKRIVDE